jgi:hypothetical protein
MSKGRAPLGRASARSGSVEVFIRPERSLAMRLAGLAWRLRTEIILGAVGLWVWHRATRVMPGWLVLVVLVVLLAGVFGWPTSRRFVAGHMWCTLSRHRVRACLIQCRVMNHHGYVPWFLWVRPTNVGERLWLLCRPGISVRDFEDKTTQLAAACWARDARVGAWRRLAAVITVDVIRRDPLTAGRLIGNPLTAELADSELAPLMPELGKRPAALVAVPDLPAQQPPAPTEVRAEEPVAVAASGEDVSDYV